MSLGPITAIVADCSDNMPFAGVILRTDRFTVLPRLFRIDVRLEAPVPFEDGYGWVAKLPGIVSRAWSVAVGQGVTVTSAVIEAGGLPPVEFRHGWDVHDEARLSADGFLLATTTAEREIQQVEGWARCWRRLVLAASTHDAIGDILGSIERAWEDADNLLVHLYEVPERIALELGVEPRRLSQDSAMKVQWKRLNQLANNTDILQGRHRGRHSRLRLATGAEHQESWKCALALFNAYVDRVATSEYQAAPGLQG
jgi:hypothetical protein